MSGVRIIEVKESAFSSNEKEAELLRKELKENGTFMINVMSAPGSGKTTLLTKLINAIKDKVNILEMDVDIESDVDAKKVADLTGVKSIQIHNGGLCHIDAFMTRECIKKVDLTNVDLLILENIGNLVCPAEFDTGANMNMMLLSVPEGDDKPLKYPLMFSVCDLVIITKIDTLPIFDFDMEKCKERIKRLNPNATIIAVSAKTGECIDDLAKIIINNMENKY